MYGKLNLLPLFLYFGFGFSLSLDDLEKTFKHEKCIQGSFTTIDQSPGILTSARIVEGNSALYRISTEELALYNISNTQDKGSLSKLHELAQYHGIESVYTLISEEGPPHSRLFKVRLNLGDETFIGEAKTIKKAKQNAASIALQNTKFESKTDIISEKTAASIVSLTPTVKLNNIAAKLGMAVKYSIVTNISPKQFTYDNIDVKTGKTYLKKLNASMNSTIKMVPEERERTKGPFTVKLEVDTMEFLGFASNIQDARHDAAMKAVEHLKRQSLHKRSSCTKEGTEEDCLKVKEAIKSPVSKIYETGQKHKINTDFVIVSESGPAHNKVFVTRCILGDFTTEGEGRSKKESKQLAAEKMLENVQFLPHIDDSNEIVNSLRKRKKKKKKKILSEFEDKEDGESGGGIMGSVISMFGGSPESYETNDNLDDSRGHSTDDRSAGSDKPYSKNKKTYISSEDSAKDTLLNVANALQIEVNFNDLGQKQDRFHTLLSLGVNPPYICFEKAPTVEKSMEKVSFEGLKLLFRNGAEERLLRKTKDIEYIRSIKHYLNTLIFPDDIKVKSIPEKEL